MRKTASNPPQRLGRQRSVAAEAAILKAAMDLFSKKPLSEVTSEAIAKKAGVSKATIYKWWPNKTLVALDAFTASLTADVSIANTGSAREDFTRQLKDVIHFFKSPMGRMFRQFLAEGQNDDGFLELFRERFLKPRRDSLRVIWQRGIERGEIRREVEVELVLDLVFAPMVYRLLVGHGPLNENHAAAMIDTIFRGLKK